MALSRPIVSATIQPSPTHSRILLRRTKWGDNESVEVESQPTSTELRKSLKEERIMDRKAIFFLLFIVSILVVSNIQGVFFHSSKNLPDPRHIDGSELASVPPVEDTIKFFQERIKANPEDAVSYALLAEQYARQARETGDTSGYERAEAALKETLRALPNYGQANAALASVYYAQHEFIPALELAQQVYEGNPMITDALVTIGDAQMALGNYPEAEAAYKELSEQNATPPVLARLAAFEELMGNPQESLDLMS